MRNPPVLVRLKRQGQCLALFELAFELELAQGGVTIISEIEMFAGLSSSASKFPTLSFRTSLANSRSPFKKPINLCDGLKTKSRIMVRPPETSRKNVSAERKSVISFKVIFTLWLRPYATKLTLNQQNDTKYSINSCFSASRETMTWSAVICLMPCDLVL